MVIDYKYYTESYCGRLINEQEFDYFAKKANAYVEMITRGRSKQSSAEQVKMAICAAAECYWSEENGGCKASETVGDYSVSYAQSGKGSCADSRKSAVLPYLSSTGLLGRSC